MLVFAIDDEKAMLDELVEAITAAEPAAEVRAFKRARPALEAIEGGVLPDVVFSDIELPGADGLALARQVKAAVPHAKVVFVTAHPGYAVDAFRLHADGFVVKPVDAARVREELDALFPEASAPSRLRVRCFGTFEVFYGDEPLALARTRSKELLALLIDRNGGTCTGAELADALWEGGEVSQPAAYLRMLTRDLREALEAAGLGDVLVRSRNRWAVRTDLIDCDYYRMLAGDPDAAASFTGEYMRQYSWAEETTARLHFMRQSMG